MSWTFKVGIDDIPRHWQTSYVALTDCRGLADHPAQKGVKVYGATNGRMDDFHHIMKYYMDEETDKTEQNSSGRNIDIPKAKRQKVKEIHDYKNDDISHNTYASNIPMQVGTGLNSVMNDERETNSHTVSDVIQEKLKTMFLKKLSHVEEEPASEAPVGNDVSQCISIDWDPEEDSDYEDIDIDGVFQVESPESKLVEDSEPSTCVENRHRQSSNSNFPIVVNKVDDSDDVVKYESKADVGKTSEDDTAGKRYLRKQKAAHVVYVENNEDDTDSRGDDQHSDDGDSDGDDQHSDDGGSDDGDSDDGDSDDGDSDGDGGDSDFDVDSIDEDDANTSEDDANTSDDNVIEMQYHCLIPGCDKSCQYKSGLIRHMSAAHPEVKDTEKNQSRCVVQGCGKSYQDNHGLRKHMSDTHPEVKKQCRCAVQGCGKSYQYNHGLRRHMSAAHPEVKDTEKVKTDKNDVQKKLKTMSLKKKVRVKTDTDSEVTISDNVSECVSIDCKQDEVSDIEDIDIDNVFEAQPPERKIVENSEPSTSFDERNISTVNSETVSNIKCEENESDTNSYSSDFLIERRQLEYSEPNTSVEKRQLSSVNSVSIPNIKGEENESDNTSNNDFNERLQNSNAISVCDDSDDETVSYVNDDDGHDDDDNDDGHDDDGHDDDDNDDDDDNHNDNDVNIIDHNDDNVNDDKISEVDTTGKGYLRKRKAAHVSYVKDNKEATAADSDDQHSDKSNTDSEDSDFEVDSIDEDDADTLDDDDDDDADDDDDDDDDVNDDDDDDDDDDYNSDSKKLSKKAQSRATNPSVTMPSQQSGPTNPSVPSQRTLLPNFYLLQTDHTGTFARLDLATPHTPVTDTPVTGPEQNQPAPSETTTQPTTPPTHIPEAQRELAAVLALRKKDRDRHIIMALSETTAPPTPPTHVTDAQRKVAVLELQKKKTFACSVPGCDRKFVRKSNVNRHIRHDHPEVTLPDNSMFNEKTFACSVPGCDKIFVRKSNVNRHIRHDHPKVTLPDKKNSVVKERKWKCPVDGCGKRYLQNRDWNKHIRIRHPEYALLRRRDVERPFKCPIPGCDKAYLHNRERNKHIRKYHPEYELQGRTMKKNWKCPIQGCGLCFYQDNHRKKHMRELHPENELLDMNMENRYQCSIEGCDKSYKYRNDRDKHIRKVHPEVALPGRTFDKSEKQYPCGIEGCDKTYKYNGDRTKHIRDFHPEVELPVKNYENRYQCSIEGCDKSYKYRNDRDKHIRKVHPEVALPGRTFDKSEKQYPCSIEGCDKSYINTGDRNRHIQQCHPDGVLHNDRDMKTLKCPVEGCDKAYELNNSRNIHIRKFHPEYTVLSKNMEESYTCPVPNCDNCYATVNDRGNHIRRDHPDYTAETSHEQKQQMYICDVSGCGKEFTNTQDWDHHQKSAPPEPFVCRESGCGQKFQSNLQRKAHEVTEHSMSNPEIDKPFMCVAPGCCRTFCTRKSSRNHLRTMHPELYVKGTYSQPTDGKFLVMKSHAENDDIPFLWRYMKGLLEKFTRQGDTTFYTNKPYACKAPGCTQRFFHEKDLNSHKRAKHKLTKCENLNNNRCDSESVYNTIKNEAVERSEQELDKCKNGVDLNYNTKDTKPGHSKMENGIAENSEQEVDKHEKDLNHASECEDSKMDTDIREHETKTCSEQEVDKCDNGEDLNDVLHTEHSEPDTATMEYESVESSKQEVDKRENGEDLNHVFDTGDSERDNGAMKNKTIDSSIQETEKHENCEELNHVLKIEDSEQSNGEMENETVDLTEQESGGGAKESETVDLAEQESGGGAIENETVDLTEEESGEGAKENENTKAPKQKPDSTEGYRSNSVGPDNTDSELDGGSVEQAADTQQELDTDGDEGEISEETAEDSEPYFLEWDLEDYLKFVKVKVTSVQHNLKIRATLDILPSEIKQRIKDAMSIDSAGVTDDIDNSDDMGIAENKSDFQVGQYVIAKSDAHNEDTFVVWKIYDAALIQKHETIVHGNTVYHKPLKTYCGYRDLSENYICIKVKQGHMRTNRDLVQVREDSRPKRPINIKLEEEYDKKPLIKQFTVYMQALLSQALEPIFLDEVTKTKDAHFIVPMLEIDKSVKQKLRQMEKKLKWTKKIKEALKKAPHLREVMRAVPDTKCEGIENSTETLLGSAFLYGRNYDNTTLDVDLSQDLFSQEFKLGKTALTHISTYHRLCHFRFHHFGKCKAKIKLSKGSNVEDGSNENVEQIVDLCLHDHKWLLRVFDDVSKLIKMPV